MSYWQDDTPTEAIPPQKEDNMTPTFAAPPPSGPPPPNPVAQAITRTITGFAVFLLLALLLAVWAWRTHTLTEAELEVHRIDVCTQLSDPGTCIGIDAGRRS